MSIGFRTYNIFNDRNGGLESAFRGMYQANMYLGIFQEMTLNNGVYTRGSARYIIVATDTPIQHCGRVVVFYRTFLRFSVEVVHQFGPNVVVFQL